MTPPAAVASRQAAAPKPTRKRAPNRTPRPAPCEPAGMPPIHPTLDRAMRELLHRVDFPDAEILTHDDLHHWGDEAAEAFVSSGIVVPAGLATEIPCPECRDGTLIRVERLTSGERCLGVCWGGGDPHQVSPGAERVRLWKFSLDGLASLIADRSQVRGRVEVVVPDRLVLVGSIDYRGAAHELLISRGATWPDARATMASSDRLRRSALPMVLSIGRMPPTELWLGMRPAVGQLDAVLRWTIAGATLQLAATASQEVVAHAESGPGQWLTVTHAAERLLDVRSGIDLPKARARVSRAAGDAKFRTNGLAGVARRIHEPSFSIWLLRERAAELASP
jgi:hypothetical protein